MVGDKYIRNQSRQVILRNKTFVTVLRYLDKAQLSLSYTQAEQKRSIAYHCMGRSRGGERGSGPIHEKSQVARAYMFP